jgi:hypothetical protein
MTGYMRVFLYVYLCKYGWMHVASVLCARHELAQGVRGRKSDCSHAHYAVTTYYYCLTDMDQR